MLSKKLIVIICLVVFCIYYYNTYIIEGFSIREQNSMRFIQRVSDGVRDRIYNSYPNVDYGAQGDLTYKTGSLDEIKRICDLTPGCNGFFYNGLGGHLKSIKPGKGIPNTNVSGTYYYTTTPPSPEIFGRYIKLNNRGDYINLTEIQVFSDETNVAKGALITGSSSSVSNPITNLVDGNTDSLGHTNGGGNEWVQIDLGTDTKITKIVVHNRKDCCEGRVIGANMEIRNSNKGVVWSSEPFKGKDGGTTPRPHPDRSGFITYTMHLPSTGVTGS